MIGGTDAATPILEAVEQALDLYSFQSIVVAEAHFGVREALLFIDMRRCMERGNFTSTDKSCADKDIGTLQAVSNQGSLAGVGYERE